MEKAPNEQGKKTAFPKRVLANLQAQLSWKDLRSGETISISGVTENVGEAGALVKVDVLPLVGSDVKLRLFDGDKKVIETFMKVIRVERDPGKPLVALSVVNNLRKWQKRAISAAQIWVRRNWKLNYEEEWA